MELKQYLPKRHQETMMGKAQEALWPEVRAEELAREDILDQLFIETATWGLQSWERALALETPQESFAVRRSRIKAKLRGVGSVTKEMLKEVALSYARGDIDVVEHISDFLVEIHFVNQIGKPDGIESLKASLEDIMPAHLAVGFFWNYRTWLEAKAFTWQGAGAYTWRQLREMEIR